MDNPSIAFVCGAAFLLVFGAIIHAWDYIPWRTRELTVNLFCWFMVLCAVTGYAISCSQGNWWPGVPGFDYIY